MFSIIVPSAAENPSELPTRVRDQVLLDGLERTDNILFLADFKHDYGWPSGAAPVDNAVVKDIADNADAAFDLAAGQTVSYDGMVDMSALTVRPAEVTIPASVAASIWPNQRFMTTFYVRLPAEDDWWTGNNPRPFLCWTTSNSGYATPSADLVTIGQGTVAGVKYLIVRRQTALGAEDNNVIAVPASYFGKVAQVSFWRGASEQYIQLRTSAGTAGIAVVDNGNNVANFSANAGHFGVGLSLWSLVDPVQQDASNFAIGRIFIADLTDGALDPRTVNDGDWDRHGGKWG